ncbi:hypothetical protein [Pseudoalteromonas pernae]|uniref:hypothetical protein n=1 Tax=Pseudoalteromonas pernae TaxID=3118054 RepID=UPI00324256DA
MRSPLFLLVCLALAACNGESNSADDQPPIKSGTNIHTLDNNGDKIRWQADKLHKGVQVFNLSMQEYGVVTGDIIVVSKQLPIGELEAQFNIEQRQDSTYSLALKDEGDLAVALQQLKALPQIQIAELQIDYSPIDKAVPTM